MQSDKQKRESESQHKLLNFNDVQEEIVTQVTTFRKTRKKTMKVPTPRTPRTRVLGFSTRAGAEVGLDMELSVVS